jgi:hypothetical protein
MTDTIRLNKDDAIALQNRYHQALAAGEKQFVFMDRDILTDYAKYMIEYLKTKGLLDQETKN